MNNWVNYWWRMKHMIQWCDVTKHTVKIIKHWITGYGHGKLSLTLTKKPPFSSWSPEFSRWLWGAPWVTFGWGYSAAPPSPEAWWPEPTSTRQVHWPASSTRAPGSACRRSGPGSPAWSRPPSWRTKSQPQPGSCRGLSLNLQKCTVSYNVKGSLGEKRH